MAYSSPMIAKVPEKLRTRLKNLSTDTRNPYGSLRSIFDTALNEFLQSKVWKTDPYFVWKIPAKNVEAQKEKWVLFNVVAEDSICNKVKNEAWKLEISLQTFLYTGLTWWYHNKAQHAEDSGEELIKIKKITDVEDDLFVHEAKELIKKPKRKKEEIS